MSAPAAGSGKAAGAPPPEEVTQKEIASRLLVTDRQVRNWKRDRELPVRRRATSAGREEEYHVWADVLEWYVAFRIQLAGQRGGRPIAAPDGSVGAAEGRMSAAEASQREAVARALKAEVDAESAQLTLQERRRTLVSLHFLDRNVEAILHALRSGLVNFPGRWAQRLLPCATLPEMRTVLDLAVSELMQELAQAAAEAEDLSDSELSGEWGDEVGEEADGGDDSSAGG